MMLIPAVMIPVFLMSMQAPAPVRSLDKGVDSQVDSARQMSARTDAEWQALWRQHAGERARPTVDFTREIVAGVFLGSRPTAGFAVEIVGVREDGSTLVVQYRETRPSPGAVTAQVLTMPYHIVAVPRRAGMTDVRFEKVG
jgi:hypothetical protein